MAIYQDLPKWIHPFVLDASSIGFNYSSQIILDAKASNPVSVKGNSGFVIGYSIRNNPIASRASTPIPNITPPRKEIKVVAQRVLGMYGVKVEVTNFDPYRTRNQLNQAIQKFYYGFISLDSDGFSVKRSSLQYAKEIIFSTEILALFANLRPTENIDLATFYSSFLLDRITGGIIFEDVNVRFSFYSIIEKWIIKWEGF